MPRVAIRSAWRVAERWGAPYRLYRTRDGYAVTLGALEPKFWQAVVERLGLPELKMAAFHGGPGAEQLVEQLTAAFAARTRAELCELLGGGDTCFEPVLNFSEVREHPQWQERRSFLTMRTASGATLRLPKMPGTLAGFETEERGA